LRGADAFDKKAAGDVPKAQLLIIDRDQRIGLDALRDRL
jgi:hypothetical protein